MRCLLPLLLLLCSVQSYAQFNLSNSNLIAYYPLNGNFLDYSGNGNHAIGHGNINFMADKNGQLNAAAGFDGVDDWIETPLTDFAKGSFTILFQIRKDTTGPGNVFKKTTPTNTQFFLNWNGGTNAGMTYNYAIRTTCNTSNGIVSGGTTPIANGQWHCVGFSYDRDSAISRVFAYNGVTHWAITPFTTARMDTCINPQLMIGNLGTYLKGAIDEVRVYSASFLTGNASTGAVSSAAVFTAYCDSLPLLMQPFIDTMLCQGGSFNLGYSGGRFFSGNTVIVQLSNSSGSFANAVTIGSVSTTTTPGTISCTIPVNTPLGTGYRIRIRSTNLADTTDNNGKNIRISGYPFVSAISNSPICAGTSLFLAASGTAGSVYSWTGPGGFNSSVQNPVIANAPATASGDYIASATLFGCTSKDTVAATVYATPATLVASANTPLCAGDTLKLNCNNAGAGASHSWTGPGSFSSPAQNPVLPGVAVSHSGDYILTASLNGCIKNDTVTVLVKPMPAIPSVNNNGPLCDGDTLQLFAQSSTPGVSYSWTGPAYSSSQQNPVILNASTLHTGSYLVTATLNGCTTAPIATYAVVNLIPATPSASSNSPVCAGGVLNLLSSSATAGVNYIWSGPNNFTSNQQNPVISPAPVNGSGNYTVVAELNGCTSSGSGTTNVVVSNVSSLGVYPSPNDTLCENNKNATFVAVPFNAGTSPQYQWYKNGNPISGATNISYPATNIADGDTFQCRMIVTGQCPQQLTLFSNKIGMTVLPMTGGPSVTITADPPGQLKPWQLVKFTAVATNAGTDPKYQWKRNGQNVAGATSFTWSANNLSHNDTITCEVTSSVWCANPPTATSNRIDVDIALGIDDVEGDDGIRLYPNSNNGMFTLVLPPTPSGGGYVSLEVVNAVGQVVYKSTIQPARQSTIDVALPESVGNGIYLLKLRIGHEAQVIRFMVSR